MKIKKILLTIFIVVNFTRAFALVNLLTDENIDDLSAFISFKINEKSAKIIYFSKTDLEQSIKTLKDFDFNAYKEKSENIIEKEENERNKGLSDEEIKRNFLLGKNITKINNKNEKFAKNIPLFLSEKLAQNIKQKNIIYEKFYIEFLDNGLNFIFISNNKISENIIIKMKLLEKVYENANKK